MSNRGRKLIRIISICLITSLFAGVILSTQTKIVRAAEAFLEVQREWTSSIGSNVKTFTILEVADRKSSFPELFENDQLKWLDSYEENKSYRENVASIKAIIDSQISLGEEEIGYLISNEEVFYEKYNELINISRAYSRSKEKEKELAVVQAYYEAIREKVHSQITTYDDNVTIDVLAPLSLIEGTAFQPNIEEYDDCLRFLENVSLRDENPITKGWLVEDPNGVYAAEFMDVNNNPTSFKFIGEPTDTPTMFRVVETLKNTVEDSLSDNSISDNNVEGVMEQDKEDEDSLSDNDIKKENIETVKETETIVPSEAENKTETTVPSEVENKTETTVPSEAENKMETTTPSEPENKTEPTIPPIEEGEIEATTSSDEEKETVTEAEIISLTETEEGEETSLGYRREIFFGKQVLLMSNNESGDILSEEQEGTNEIVTATRYSFYLEKEDIPDALKENSISVVVSNNNTAEITEEDIDNTISNSPAQIDAIYQYHFVGIKNNEWFKTYVFGLDATTFDKLNVEVETYTPAELTEAIIKNANLIYWNSRETSSDVLSETKPDGKDISVDNALVLLNQITGEKSIPCIINHGAYINLNIAEENEQVVRPVNNNINKMLQLLYQEEIESTYKKSEYEFTAATKWGDVITDTSTDNITIWEQIQDTISILNSGHFVRDNVYVINHAINAVMYQDSNNNIVLNGIKDKVRGEEQEISVAFDEVVYRIEREIYERQNTAGASSWNDTIITPAVAIQTILTYTKTPAVIEKSHITVLELQPCYSFTYANGNESAFKAKFLPENASVEVEIIGMTTSEFCGKIEDINVKYDMIYIGSNTELFNRMEVVANDYCTTYNDFNMYGVVYAHTGDLCHIGSHSGSLAAHEMNTYRYSGNDILESQASDLIDFLQSGAPIVVADDFFVRETLEGIDTVTKISAGALKTKDADGNVIDVTVDDTKRGDTATGIIRNGVLDSSSYVYQFVKNACVNEADTNADGTIDKIYSGEANWTWNNRKYANFLVESEVNTTSFSRWLNQPKMSIHMLSQPTEYNYTTKRVGISNVIDDSSFLQKDGDYYYLTYEFYISSIASEDIQNTRYEVSLWVDTNMDGKFSDNTENLTDSELVVKNIETRESVNRDNLKTGVHYQVRRKLPTEIIGAVPWKLEIKHGVNSALRNATTGITAVRVPEKQTIKVLQLYQGAANIQSYMEQGNNHWNALLNNVPDFKVEVTSVEATNYFNGSQEIELSNYDMLIVGFSDNYQGSTNFSKTALENIIEYAESGKCVLFSHDNTNWVNSTANNLNTSIRDISGLDRYGVSIYRNKTEMLFSKNYVKNGEDIRKATREELVSYLFGDSGLNGYKRDIAFKVNSNQAVMDSRTQGLSYSGNEHDRYAVTVKSDGIKDKNRNSYGDYYRYLNFANANANTWINVASNGYSANYEVEKVNVGAITEYPYRLNNTMKIASTHGQYFQLDLDSDNDGDGEGDIVVWYTINDSVAGDMNDIYDYSPNDVRNNYYIYNKGNITYTGMGHANIKDNEEEVKLFINTMIAAYRVAMQSPNLNIIEGNSDNTDKSFDAIPFDGNVANNEIVYNVYFKAEDVNLISESKKNVRCKIYMGGGNKTININGENLNVTEKTGQANIGWKIFDTVTNTEVAAVYDTDKNEYYYPIISGKEYYVQVPLVENPGTADQIFNLSETKSLDFYIEVQSFITKNNKKNESALIYDNFKLTQINLFDLD